MMKRLLCALLTAAMLVTGMAGALAEECETHSWSDGVCTVCSHPDSKQTGGTQKNTVTVDNGDGTHTRSFDVIHLYTCTTCGDVERRYIERGSETEEHHWKSDNTCADGCGAVKPCEHTWSNGVCTACGYECPHTERKQTGGDQENKTIVDNKDGTHTRSFDVIHLYTCTTCGDVERRYIERGSETEEHHWKSDNTCADGCGAVKPHEHSWSNGQCTGCGEVCSHDWSDGVCTVCGYACGHDWKDATCTAPKTCSECGVTEGSANGHSWKAATCTVPKMCSVCNETEGTPLSHDWQEATCSAPKTCSRCNATEGGTLPHSWNDGTCSECGASCPGHDYQQTGSTSETSYAQWNDTQHKAKIAYFKTMTCSTCGHSTQESGGEQEEFQNHEWADGKCTACGHVCQHPSKQLTYNDNKSWEEALPSVAENENTHTDYYIVHDVFDCACGLEFEPPTEPKSAPGQAHTFDKNDVCTACGYKKGEIVCDHVWTDATCTAPQTCSKCNTTVGEPKGHSWSDGVCGVCGEPCSHDWSEATCTAPKTCGRCGVTEGEAKGHDWSNRDGVCANQCGETCEHSWSDGECTK